jgi:hypothetical protein
MNQKKEYVAPEMDVLEYMVEASLLVDSPKSDNADADSADNIEFD